MKHNNNTYDVIVVGSGAGGATIAREMSRRHKKVLLLEQGGKTRSLGNTMTVAMSLSRLGLLRSREKHVVTVGANYGGLSLLAAGCAVAPPKSVFAPVGIDLTAESESARKDLGVCAQPDHLIGKQNLRLLEAAHDAGFSWQKLEKFVDPERCTGSGNCMLGCKSGAKFTARRFGDEARQNGADLLLRTRVTDILRENDTAVGVSARRFGRTCHFYGRHIVLSASVGNVPLLRKAGIEEAGQHFCCDWLQFVGARIPQLARQNAVPMGVGSMEWYESDGIIIVPVFPNWSQFAVMLGMMGPRHLARLPAFRDYVGIMVKIRDEKSGRIFGPADFSKPVSAADGLRLDKGLGIIKKVFQKAGAAPESIFSLPPSGAHPSAMCSIGHVVDCHLETRIKNLYCCDASVFPEALGLPTIWTIVSLGKRLAGHLEQRLGPSSQSKAIEAESKI